MAYFNYIAKTKEGKTIRDREEAVSKEEVIAKLRTRGLFIVEVKGLEKRQPTSAVQQMLKFSSSHGKRSSIKLQDTAFLARNLATTLASGVTLLRSLEIIALQSPSIKLGTILQKCSASVKEGLSLSEAISKYPNVFSPLWRGIVEVGEASGNLPYVLERLAEYLSVRMEFERRIKSALIYPTIVLGVAIVAMIIFFKMILPKFSEIFGQFNIQLPFVTEMLFSISKIVEKYFIFILLGIAIGAVLIYQSFRNPETRKVWDKINLKTPIIKDIILLSCLERFTATMHILLESGLPLVSTLEISSHAVGNSLVEKSILRIKDKVREGGSLAQEFTRAELFPPLVSEMAKIGEETGTMPQIFQKISAHYQKELTTLVDRIVVAFEPAMILLLGILIGTMVIALFLPLFQLSTMGGR